MEEDYDLSKVPFFNEFGGMDFQAFDNMGEDMRTNSGEADAMDVYQIRQNMRQIKQTLDRLESLLKDATAASGQRTKRSFWSQEEHFQFLRLVQKYGRQNIKEVARGMAHLRTLSQVRTHAQKYFDKLDRHCQEAQKLAQNSASQVFPDLSQRLRRVGITGSGTRPEIQFYEAFNQKSSDGLRGLFDTAPVVPQVDFMQALEPLFQVQITAQPVPLPLVCVSNAQRILRGIFPEMPYGGYLVTSTQELQGLVLLAVSGQFQPHLLQTNGFVQLVYQESNELLIDRATPKFKFNMSSIDFDQDQAEFVQLNINPFLRHCAAFLAANLGQKQFLYDFFHAISLCVRQIQQVSDPFDYVLSRVAESIQKTPEDVSCYLFCYCALWSYQRRSAAAQ